MEPETLWRLRAACSALLGAVLLAGCNGNGDSSPGRGLVETTPESGNQSAAPGAPVTARFAESLRPDTVNGDTVKVDQEGTLVTGTVGYDDNRHEIRFDPAVPLDMLTNYRVELSNAILGTDGHPIEAATWGFRTRDGAWEDAESPPPIELDGNEPLRQNETAQAYAPDGSLWVLSVESDSLVGQPLVAARRTSAGWEQPQVVGRLKFKNVDIFAYRRARPSMAVNSQGAAIAVWLDPTYKDDHLTPADELWSARWDGTAWSEPERIGLPTGRASYPEVSIDDSGNAVVVWWHDDPFSSDHALPSRLLTQRYVAGEDWQSPQEGPFGPKSTNYSVIEVQSNGDAFVIWSEWLTTEVSAARFSPSTGWSNTSVCNLTGTAEYIVAHQRRDGSAVAVWTQREAGNTTSQWFAILQADGTLQTPVQLDPDVYQQELAVGPTGEAWLAYVKRTYPSGSQLLMRRLSANASEWQEPRQVVFSPPTSPGQVRLVLDHKGRGLMTIKGSRLWSSRLADPSGDTWSTPEPISDEFTSYVGLAELVGGGVSGRAVQVLTIDHYEDSEYTDFLVKRFE